MRTRWILLAWAAAAAALGLPLLAAADDSGSKDELAEGEWEGDGEFKVADADDHDGGGGDSPPDDGGSDDGVASGGEDDAGGDDGEGEGGEEGGRDIPTPSCPIKPDPAPPEEDGEEEEEEDDPDDGGEDTPPTDAPWVTPVDPRWSPAGCQAHWKWEVEQPNPDLHEAATTLTLVLFRTDAWAFVCSAYCRSESTWYVDWGASTAASHSGRSKINYRLRLVGGCGECGPVIRLVGASQLETRAQVKSSWGEVDPGTTAEAQAAAVWAGPLDCSDDCAARAEPDETSSRWGVGFFGLKSENSSSTGYSYASAMGGKGASVTIKATEIQQLVTDRASVATNAGGTECNAQAKARVGYDFEIHARTGHGDLADLVVELEEK